MKFKNNANEMKLKNIIICEILDNKEINITSYIGCSRKSEPLFVKDFLGNNKTKFIEN